MPAEASATALSPLLASLREEGKKAGVIFDFSDPGFVRKIENLSRQVEREYDIVQAFRAFLADQARGITPFWFPERFEKYKHRAAAAASTHGGSEAVPKALIVDDPRTPDGFEVLRKCAARGDTWAAHTLAAARASSLKVRYPGGAR